MNPKRAITRSWFYFWMGYAKYLAFPMLIISFSSNVYNLTVKNIPFLLRFFPKLHIFALWATVIVYPLGSILGWFHYKKSPFYKAEQEIITEASPYTTEKIPKISISNWVLFEYMARERGLHKAADAIKGITDFSAKEHGTYEDLQEMRNDIRGKTHD